jgi:hypothetical protein
MPHTKQQLLADKKETFLTFYRPRLSLFRARRRAGCSGGKTSVLLRVKSAPDASNTPINDSDAFS